MVMNTRKIAGKVSTAAAERCTPRKPRIAAVIALALGIAAAGWQSSALADARTQAKRLHDRIASVPPSDATLNSMASMISGGNALGAADIATQSSAFYNVTLKNFADRKSVV